MKVYYTFEVEDYFVDLVKILHEKDYFTDYNNAKKYVLRLKKKIEETIQLKQTYKTPDQLKQYGLHFKKISISKRTTWVLIYTHIGSTYYINFITNNHSKEAEYMQGLK